jgi:Tfp pilus assembly protein PilV
MGNLNSRRKNYSENIAIPRRLRGFSTVEVLVTVLIYALIITSGYLLITTGTVSWQVNNAKVELQQELRKAMEWMSLDLRQAGPASISDVSVNNTWSTQITFRVASGVSGGIVTWSTAQYRYYLGGTGNRQLKRLDVTSGAVKDIAQNIKVLQVRRPVSNPDIVEVALTGETTTAQGRVVNLTLNFEVNLRN